MRILPGRGLQQGTKSDEENLVVHRARKNFIILNLYPYSTGHLMVVPYEHVDMLQYASQETLEEMILLVQRIAAPFAGDLPAAGIQSRNEFGGKRGRRNRRAHPHARAAALAGRHQFHDHRRRNARVARGSGNHLAQAARRVREARLTRMVLKRIHFPITCPAQRRL